MAEKKIELSREEQAVVYSFLNEKAGFWAVVYDIWPYFLPLMLLTIYGVIIFDPIVILGSVLFLFVAFFWYLGRVTVTSKHLQSALKKIDCEVDLY
jgi:uncharacterized membrane protein